MLCNTQQWVIRWSFKFWVFTFLNLPPKIKCWVALTKVFFNQIFLHFGQFYLYSRNVCNKRLANCTAVTDTLALNGFTRNAKHGFDSWKWSNLARNSSSSLTIYLSILPLCGLQLTDRQTDRQTNLFNIWKNQISGGGEWPQGIRVILPLETQSNCWEETQVEQLRRRPTVYKFHIDLHISTKTVQT